MKRWIPFLLVVSVVTILTACGKGAPRDEEATTPSDDTASSQVAEVVGTVEGIVGTDVTIRVTDRQSSVPVSAGESIVFHMADLDSSALKNVKEGDTLRVAFNGILTKSIPPQATATTFTNETMEENE